MVILPGTQKPFDEMHDWTENPGRGILLVAFMLETNHETYKLGPLP